MPLGYEDLRKHLTSALTWLHRGQLPLVADALTRAQQSLDEILARLDDEVDVTVFDPLDRPDCDITFEQPSMADWLGEVYDRR